MRIGGKSLVCQLILVLWVLYGFVAYLTYLGQTEIQPLPEEILRKYSSFLEPSPPQEVLVKRAKEVLERSGIRTAKLYYGVDLLYHRKIFRFLHSRLSHEEFQKILETEDPPLFYWHVYFYEPAKRLINENLWHVHLNFHGRPIGFQASQWRQTAFREIPKEDIRRIAMERLHRELGWEPSQLAPRSLTDFIRHPAARSDWVWEVKRGAPAAGYPLGGQIIVFARELKGVVLFQEEYYHPDLKIPWSEFIADVPKSLAPIVGMLIALLIPGLGLQTRGLQISKWMRVGLEIEIVAAFLLSFVGCFATIFQGCTELCSLHRLVTFPLILIMIFGLRKWVTQAPLFWLVPSLLIPHCLCANLMNYFFMKRIILSPLCYLLPFGVTMANLAGLTGRAPKVWLALSALALLGFFIVAILHQIFGFPW